MMMMRRNDEEVWNDHLIIIISGNLENPKI